MDSGQWIVGERENGSALSYPLSTDNYPLRKPRPQAITGRAIFLGLVTVVVMLFLVNYQYHVAVNAVLTLAQLPVCVLIVFVLWVGINSVVKAVRPRSALTATEMLTIFVMCWSAGMLGGRGWTGRLIGMLVGPQHFASPENRWLDILGGLGRDGLLPTWLFPDFETQAVRWFYMSAPPGVAIPWAVWATPLLWWSAAAIAFLALAMATTVVFHRQWAVHERLNFPLMGVPIALVEEAPGRRAAPVLRKRLFWIGIAASGGVLSWNIVQYFAPAWPRIDIYALAGNTSQQLIRGFPEINFRIMPLVIGFLYLANLDLLLSLWVFYLLGWIEAGISETTGFAVGAAGTKVAGWDLVRVHSFGALVMLAVWSVWVARRHLRAVFRSALSRDRAADNPDGAIRYRTAIIVWLWALAFLLIFCRRMGMTWGVIGLAMGFILVAFFTVAKYMAATGLSYINPSYSASGVLITNLAGNAWMTPQSVIGLGIMHGGYFGAGQRLFGFGMMPHAFKAAERAERGRRRIVPALILAVLVGSAFSFWHTLYLGYTRGGLRMAGYTLNFVADQDFGYIMKNVDKVQRHRGLSADWEKVGAFGVGFALAGIITLLHTRFTWWPLHPVGLAFSSTSAGVYWLSILIVWLAKLIILKVGGTRLYEKAKPFFIGLIVGYVLALIVSFSVDAIFFAGQPGHRIHDW